MPSSPSDLARLDQRHVWHPFTQMQAWQQTAPLIIERAEGNYLFDTHGRRYLDGVSSLWVTVHGHRCPEIDAAVRAQLDRVAHSTLLGLANVPSIELAAELARIAPGELSRVFYSDSGSTAVEVALKIAFQYWQQRGRTDKTHFVALEDAYHGDTIGAVSLGGIDLFHRIFHPLLFSAHRIPTPHPYRSESGDPAASAERSLAALASLLAEHAATIAALVIEPRVQGAAGMIVHPEGYLRRVADLCRSYGVLLICDEVATGFGRTGTLFSCQAEQVTPDLMAVAKGISGGYLPLAATLATDEVFEAFSGPRSHTFFHGHTYTGNPLACAASLASLSLFEKRDTLANVQGRAATLARLLADRIQPLDHVGDVRQRGLMVGVELVADRQTARPFDPELQAGSRVCMATRSRGVILRPLGDVVVVMPPLSITDDDLELLVSALRSAIVEELPA